jgi:3-oxoacyl-[acyl-carrier-protein] synthase-3
MKHRFPVKILGTGAYVPDRVVPNSHFESYLETSDEWIQTRSGIRERRFAPEDENTKTFAIEAGRRALADSGLTAEDIDLVIVATITPAHVIPATACEVQDALGLRSVPAFDLAASCSGWIYGVITASQFIESGMGKTALVIASDTLSRYIDMEDRSSCILFGDGAAATVLRRCDSGLGGILSARYGADGDHWKDIWIPAGGSEEPASQKTINERLHYVRMNGREVYKVAVMRMAALLELSMRDAGVGVDEVTLFIPHQANLRIIESINKRLGVPPEKVSINIDRYGNTSGAAVGMCLDEARRTGRVKSGDLVAMTTVGAGFAWGSLLIRL